MEYTIYSNATSFHTTRKELSYHKTGPSHIKNIPVRILNLKIIKTHVVKSPAVKIYDPISLDFSNKNHTLVIVLEIHSMYVNPVQLAKKSNSLSSVLHLNCFLL